VRGHIVVTGSAGFIESHLTDRLLDDGHLVVGMDSFEDFFLRAIKVANLLELAAVAAPGGLDAGGVTILAYRGAEVVRPK